MAKTLQQKHDFIKFMLDEQALYKPTHDARRDVIRDLLQFCLWQSGITSGALVLLVSASSEILKMGNPVPKGILVLAIIASLHTIFRTMKTYHTSTLESLNYETRISSEIVTSMLHVMPQGLDGELSTAQLQAIEKHENKQNENSQREQERLDELHRLIKIQTGWFYMTISTMTLLVGIVAFDHTWNWLF